MAYRNPKPDIDDTISLTDNEPEYIEMESVYFAFIDALGFKKTFDDIKIAGDEKELEKYKDVFSYYFEIVNNSKLMSNEKICYAGQTSDSLYFYTNRPDHLLDFIKIYSCFSLYAMSRNVFFRGGIAKGKLFRKENYQFYGDCVIGAYLLESNVSKYPRIQIDEQTNIDLFGEEGYKELTKMDNDRVYVNPFCMVNKQIEYLIESEYMREIDLQIIGRYIEKNKSIFEFVPDVYAKYSFLKKEYDDALGGNQEDEK